MNALPIDRSYVKLRTTTYDRISGGLATGVIVFGVLTVLLFLTWLAEFGTDREIPDAKQQPPKQGTYRGVDITGIADLKVPPGVNEFPEVDTPQIADAIEAITTLASKYAGRLAAADGNAERSGSGDGEGHEGDPGPPGAPESPPFERWVIEYESNDLAAYVDQLTSFGIQIGVVHKLLDRIDLVMDLDSQPISRAVARSEEQRVYFIHSDNQLQYQDMRLARMAGINPTDKILVQFCPPETVDLLTRLEIAAARDRGIKVDQIRRTIFKVRTNDGHHEYYVADVVPK